MLESDAQEVRFLPMTSTLTTALVGLFLLTGQAANSLGGAFFGTSQGPTYTVTMTGYNAVPEQTKLDPTITASGAFSNSEVVVARSQDLADELPYGTVIAVSAATTTDSCGYGLVDSQIGLRVVADAMNARMKQRIDILFPTSTVSNAAITLGLCENIAIKVVGHVDINHVPHNQAELRRVLAQNLVISK